GKALATPFGAAFVLAAGAMIISGIQSAMMEQIARLDAIRGSSLPKPAEYRARFYKANTEKDMDAIVADASKRLDDIDTARDKLTSSRRIGGRTGNTMRPLSEAEQAQMAAYDEEKFYLNRIIEFIKAQGATRVKELQAARAVVA